MTSAARTDPKTIRGLLAATTPWFEKRGFDSPRLDAELLIAHALKMKRLDLYLDLDRPLSDAELEACRALVKRRGTGEPIAYIVGSRDFYGLSLKVTPAVLIPRPDTETLVEHALALLPEDAEGVVVDVGTGSGCIVLALLSAREGLRGVGVDISAAALAVAAENAAATGLADRVTFVEGDLLAPVHGTADVLLVVSNPPYVVRGSPLLEKDVATHEPALALYGDDDDGLGHHRRILAGAAGLVVDGGAVVVEIGADQGDAVRGLAQAPWRNVRVEKDLGGHPRVGVFTR